MRSKKRRTPQPLNFTPEEPRPRRGEERVRVADFTIAPPPRPNAEPPPAASTDGDLMLGVSPGTRQGPPPLGWAEHAYLCAFIAALAWAGLLFAYTIGYVGGFSGLMRAPMQLAVVTLMAALPAVFVFAGAFAIRQGARLAAEARWTRAMAEDFVTPAVMAAARTGDIAATVRSEVERASAAAIAAHGQLVSVRETLAGERERLTEVAAEAQHVARAVGDTLTREREAMGAALAGLRSQADALASGVERQTRMVGEASDLARIQLQEAEATLASGAERLAAASADTGVAARDAGEHLAHQAERLDTAAAALSERLRFLDARLNDQRHALSNLLSTLDADQDDVAARLESHRAQMLEVIAHARASVAELGQAASGGGEALRRLIEGALEQTREVAAAARSEQAALREEAGEARLQAQNELHHMLDALARAGEDARRAIASVAVETETATAARVGSARQQVDQLGELAFSAGQRADQAFQVRLNEARRLIEQTAALVEEAGVRAGERIGAGLGASRGALDELAGALGEVDERIARLPDAARGHAEAVRANVERSLADVAAAARRAAEEIQGIDAAFQDRVRRNYETLSEAVRLMGRVAGSVDFGRDLAPPRAAAAAPGPPPAEILAGPPALPVSEPVAATADPFAAFAKLSEAAAPRRAPEPARMEAAPPARAASPRPAPAPPVFGRATARAPEVAAGGGPADTLLEPERPAAASAAEPSPADEGLRPRLRFTPTEADEALKAVFEPRPEPEAAPGARGDRDRDEWNADLDEWTWKDLLNSMETPAAGNDALAGRMVCEIEALGVDAAALLPRVRVEDVAANFLANDAPAARDAVRRLAPAAIRRLSRRVLTDPALRVEVGRYVQRYQGDLREPATLAAAADLLASDAGRAYLLLEAAVGDL